MKSLLTYFIIGLCALFSNINLNAQQIKFVDFDLVRDSSLEMVHLDSVYTSLYDSLFVIGGEMIQEFQVILQKYTDTCAAPSAIQKIRLKIENDILTMENHQKFTLDTLPFFKTDIEKQIDTRIKNCISALTQNNDIDIIVNKKSILYRKDELDDITEQVIKQFRYQYLLAQAGWEKEVNLYIQKYQIDQHLKWNGFEDVKF